MVEMGGVGGDGGGDLGVAVADGSGHLTRGPVEEGVVACGCDCAGRGGSYYEGLKGWALEKGGLDQLAMQVCVAGGMK